MGAAARLAAVADAGPIIHLDEIGALSVLKVFTELHVPGAVWDETVGAARVDARAIEAVSGFRRQPMVDLAVLAEFVRQNGLGRLQRGECESLLVCKNERVDTLLTDDLAVRRAAQAMGITPVGSLGIVVRAMRGGLIARPAAERYIIQLYEVSSLFVTRAIVDLALEQIRHVSGDT